MVNFVVCFNPSALKHASVKKSTQIDLPHYLMSQAIIPYLDPLMKRLQSWGEWALQSTSDPFCMCHAMNCKKKSFKNLLKSWRRKREMRRPPSLTFSHSDAPWPVKTCFLYRPKLFFSLSHNRILSNASILNS